MSVYINAYSTVRRYVPWFASGPARGGASPFPDAAPVGGRALVAEDGSAYLDADVAGVEGDGVAGGAPGDAEQRYREMREHLAGFENFVVQQGVERAGGYTAGVHSVVRHLRNTRRQYVFSRPEGYGPEDLAEFSGWAAEANAVFLLPDGTVRNAAGDDLLAGASAQVGAPNSRASVERMQRIRGALWDRGYKIPTHVPPVLSEDEVVLRRPEEAFNRALAITVVASIAGLVVQSQPADVAGARLHQRRAFASLSASERDFVAAVEAAEAAATGAPAGGAAEEASPNTPSAPTSGDTLTYPDELLQQAYQLQWGFLAAEVLAWSLGMTDANLDQLEPADPGALYRRLTNVDAALTSGATTLAELRYRPLSDICELFERTFALRWYSVDQRMAAQPNPQRPALTDLQSSILLERHHALAWLTSPRTDYDEADLST